MSYIPQQIKTRNVVVIAQQGHDKYESLPFEWKGPISRDEAIDKLLTNTKIDNATKLTLTTNFLVKLEFGKFAANIPDFTKEELTNINII